MRKRIKDYVITTLFLWGAYSTGLTPVAFLIWGMGFSQWWIWLWSGLPANGILNYPIGKCYVWIRRRFID